MAQKKSYSRYFIILQEDEKGYSLSSDKVVSGYCKLEMKNEKCKVSFYVQNLKKQMAPYYMILICNKKDVRKIIKIGEMNIDDYGRADISFEYPVSNIATSNIAMDKISGAAIVKFLDDNIVPVMSGFASTEIPEWKKFQIIQEQTRHEEKSEETFVEDIENIETKPQEKSIFDKYEENVQRNVPEENKRDEQTFSDDNISRENQQDDENKADESSEFIEETDADSRLEEEYSNFNEDAEEYPVGTTGEFFRSLVKEYDEIPNLCKEIKRCKWYKIPVNCIEDLYDMSNYKKYTIMKYPMINYYPYIEKHSHYLIGHKCDKSGRIKYIVYGIPGSKDKKDQPYGGKSGFVTWIPSKQSGKDNFGYWLMFYDFRTSTIVIPVK